MGISAEDLILRPYQEVADRGNDAVTNAEASDDAELSGPLGKAGKAVAKEGERALKRLQPIWDGQVQKYGDAFREVMVANEEIDARRKVLDDLLYDFEDYVEPDTFDADKFTELQAATKAFALATIDAMKRVKIEAPKPPAARLSLFPPLPPLPPLSQARVAGDVPRPLFSPGGGQVIQKRHTGDEQSSPSVDLRPNFASGPPVQSPTGQSLVQSPIEDQQLESNGVRRILSVRKGYGVPAQLRAVSDHGLERRNSKPETPRPAPGRTATSPVSAGPRTTEWVQIHATSSDGSQSSRAPVSEEDPGEVDFVPEIIPISKFAPAHISQPDAPDRTSSIHSPTSTVFTDARHSFYSSATSVYSTQSDRRDSAAAGKLVPKMPPAPRRVRGQSEDTFKISTLDPAPTTKPSLSDQDFDPEKMLVTEIPGERASFDTMTDNSKALNQIDRSIGSRSTFQVMGGFCTGAETFRRAGPSRGIKQSIGFVDNQQAMTGRCVGCGYAHAYGEVKIDADRRSQASFHKHGARYRLRLLYKSHLDISVTAKRNAEPHYGCLFCVHNGSTAHEGDATVFATPEALIFHLVRHPQPLPLIEGIRVLYGDVPQTDQFAEDFDLHVPVPPMPTKLGAEVARTAVATAVKDNYMKFGAGKMRKPPNYSGDLLQFLAGARIVGVTFPEKWEGKWCVGWHDGVSGAFPAKAVGLEPPQRQQDMPVGEGTSGSGMCVRAKWKWQQPRPEDESSAPMPAADLWMSFEKGDVIRDVQSLGGDHWCWSGRDGRGRWGLFPQSHVLLNTLEAGTVARPGGGNASSSGSGILNMSKVKTRGLFSRTRSQSVASSLSSGRTSVIS